MLETRSERLCEPRRRRTTARPTSTRRCGWRRSRLAGELRVPFTTGILIGIGETRAERLDALLAIARPARAPRPHPGSHRPEFPRQARHQAWPRRRSRTLDDLLWTIAAARLVLGPAMNIQAPPNLSPGVYQRLVAAGHQRLGRRLAGDARPREPRSALAGIERPGRAHRGGRQGAGAAAADLSRLCRATPIAGSRRASRTRGAPRERRRRLRARATTGRRARRALPPRPAPRAGIASIRRWRARSSARDGRRAARRRRRSCALFAARDADFDACGRGGRRAARSESAATTVRYVVNRNINYTNICTYRCKFCAFSKGKTHEALRGPAYDLRP